MKWGWADRHQILQGELWDSLLEHLQVSAVRKMRGTDVPRSQEKSGDTQIRLRP